MGADKRSVVLVPNRRSDIPPRTEHAPRSTAVPPPSGADRHLRRRSSANKAIRWLGTSWGLVRIRETESAAPPRPGPGAAPPAGWSRGQTHDISKVLTGRSNSRSPTARCNGSAWRRTPSRLPPTPAARELVHSRANLWPNQWMHATDSARPRPDPLRRSPLKRRQSREGSSTGPLLPPHARFEGERDFRGHHACPAMEASQRQESNIVFLCCSWFRGFVAENSGLGTRTMWPNNDRGPYPTHHPSGVRSHA